MSYFTSFILCSTHSPIWIITRTHLSLIQVLTTGPHGCFVHHWNACVECCLWLHPIHTMHTVPIHEVPTYAHWPISHLSMVGAPLCAHHTPFPLTFCQFSHTQALPRMFRIRSHCCIWMQLPTLSPTVWSDSSSTPAPEALLLGGWHTHWRPT